MSKKYITVDAIAKEALMQLETQFYAPKCNNLKKKLRHKLIGESIIPSIDNINYSKNIFL